MTTSDTPDSSAPKTEPVDPAAPGKVHVQRLNRRATYVAAGIAVVLVWVAAFVFATTGPAARQPAAPKAPSDDKARFDQASVEKLLAEQARRLNAQHPPAAAPPSAPVYAGITPAPPTVEELGPNGAPARFPAHDPNELPPVADAANYPLGMDENVPIGAQNPYAADSNPAHFYPNSAAQRLQRAYDASPLPSEAPPQDMADGGGRSKYPAGSGGDPGFEAFMRNAAALGQSTGAGLVPVTGAAAPPPTENTLGAQAPAGVDHAAFVTKYSQKTAPQLKIGVSPPQSPYTILQGHHIPATLLVGANSDLPGQTVAMVRRNVYDSVSGRYVLIPQGSRLVGYYDDRVVYGQNRMLFAWTRILFPNGSSLDLQGMPSTDLAGASGLRDRTNNHFVRLFGSALLLSAVSAGAQLSQPQEAADGGAPSASQIAAAAVGQEFARVSGAIINRELQVQPTLELRPGLLFNIEVTADMVMPGPYGS